MFLNGLCSLVLGVFGWVAYLGSLLHSLFSRVSAKDLFLVVIFSETSLQFRFSKSFSFAETDPFLSVL